MAYRTRTYIAADWDNDKDAFDKLCIWNKSSDRELSFGDAHELSECRSDKTNNCNIKRNCAHNLDHSKSFVLIIGEHTKESRAAYCMYCKDRDHCRYKYKLNKSFVKFECDYAVRNKLPIIVLYKSWDIDKTLCIDSVADIAICHVPMKKFIGYYLGVYYWKWDYYGVKEAFDLLD